ncbi:glucan biosynthesis protein G [Acidihalobacter ferrooxydans]|uniref:Glucans biosynthesis protein G n=1 Tax=Acidihalobacter ferrooxydans TaxID=1765967 RepID=A0A1P8UL48_9GAMM|nr:glucan biosynthesis protein G [Acidihalobacter ferrooxydans]APZ44535.1 glucan biosynthesis protein G [Acidihalobacter ferrooxydans]
MLPHKALRIMIGLALVLGAASPALAVAAGFGFDQVVAKAKALAKQPYQAPHAVPKFLRELNYSTYQQIRFKPKRALWRPSGSDFQVMLVPPGLFYKHAVKINVVDAQGVHALAFDKSDFDYPSKALAKKIPANLGYAGFKLTYPLDGTGIANQFLVFAGASYFRGVGKGNTFGLSERGIAVDTGLPIGEQFPNFTEYWLVRPRPDAKAMTLYALLDGKSVTGAYRFIIRPGAPTRIQVKVELFTRHSIAQLGIAPLTSMFFYGANTPRPAGEWRPQVHDSDGLLIHNGTGEWLWRPLINPRALKLDYFDTNNVRGFGLLQRVTAFGQYEDAYALYQSRPSAWVTPDGNWGKGHVVLVEIPTPNETNDNIVAFWMPGHAVKGGEHLKFAYGIAIGGPRVPHEPMAHTVQTFVGNGDIIGGGDVKGAYRFVVDFSGGSLGKLPVDAKVKGIVTGLDGTDVLEHTVQYLPQTKQWRLSILARPASGKPTALRAFLHQGKNTLSETWTYSLPSKNKIGG